MKEIHYVTFYEVMRTSTNYIIIKEIKSFTKTIFILERKKNVILTLGVCQYQCN